MAGVHDAEAGNLGAQGDNGFQQSNPMLLPNKHTDKQDQARFAANDGGDVMQNILEQLRSTQVSSPPSMSTSLHPHLSPHNQNNPNPSHNINQNTIFNETHLSPSTTQSQSSTNHMAVLPPSGPTGDHNQPINREYVVQRVQTDHIGYHPQNVVHHTSSKSNVPQYPRMQSSYERETNMQAPVVDSFSGLGEYDYLSRAGPHRVDPHCATGVGSPFHKRRQQISPESYNGTSSLDEYLDYFTDIAGWNNWDYTEKAMQLCMNLKGSAKRAVSVLDHQDRRKYGVVVGILRRNFGNPDDEIVYQEEFWRRSRSKRELMIDFANDLKRLGRKAFSHMCDEQTTGFEKMLVNRFVSGVGDVELGRWVHMQHPRSLDEAVEIARTYESYQKVNVRSSMQQKPSNPDSVAEIFCDRSDEVRAQTSVRQANDETIGLLKQILEEQKKQNAEISEIKKQITIQGQNIASLNTQVANNTKSLKTIEARLVKVEQQPKASSPDAKPRYENNHNNGYRGNNNQRGNYNRGYHNNQNHHGQGYNNQGYQTGYRNTYQNNDAGVGAGNQSFPFDTSQDVRQGEQNAQGKQPPTTDDRGGSGTNKGAETQMSSRLNE